MPIFKREVMKNLLFVLLAFLTVFAPVVWGYDPPEIVWEQFLDFDSEYANCIDLVVTPEGGVAALGQLWPRGIMTVKFDENGNQISADTLPENHVQPTRLRASQNGGYVACAWLYEQLENWRYYGSLLIFDDDLQFQDSLIFGGSDDSVCKFNDFIEEEDGYVACGSQRESTGGYWGHAWILKCDFDGNVIWSRKYGPDERDNNSASFITKNPRGGYIVSVLFEFELNVPSYRFMWLDENGDSLFTVRGGSSSGFYVVGDSIMVPFLHGLDTYNIADGGKMSYYADNQRFEFEISKGNTPLFGGGYGTIGYSATTNVNHDPDRFTVLTCRLDDQVVEQWRSYRDAGGPNSYSGGEAIAQAPDGSLYIGGKVDNDFWVAKTAPDPAAVDNFSSPQPCTTFCLNPAYPNPFNSTTSIRYTTPQMGDCELTILDISGREIDRASVSAGDGTYPWTAPESGVYIVRLSSGDHQTARKLVCVK